MLGDRQAALLQAAATIYAGSFVPPFRAEWDGEMKDGYFQMGATDAIAKATDLLERIEAREPKPTTKCYGCGESGASNCVCPRGHRV